MYSHSKSAAKLEGHSAAFLMVESVCCLLPESQNPMRNDEQFICAESWRICCVMNVPESLVPRLLLRISPDFPVYQLDGRGVGPSKWATGRTLFGLRGFHYNMHRTPRSSLSLSLGNIELLEPVYLYLSAKNTHCGKDTPTLTPPNAQRPLYQQPRPPGDETHGLGLEKANIMGYIKMLPSRQATPPTNISISC